MPDENDQNTYFGVSIELTQRESVIINEADVDNQWKLYTLFGHFDEIRIDIIDELKDFETKSLTGLEAPRKRLAYHPETQKIFLFVKDNPKKDIRKRLEKYSDYDEFNELEDDKKPKPFIALAAIKLRHQFYGDGYHRDCLDPCECIKHYMKEQFMGESENANDRNIEFIVMRSLSIDDVYVLIGANHPNAVLRCVRKMRFYKCDKCGRHPESANSKNDIEIEFKKI